MDTRDTWTPTELIRHMRIRGWVALPECGMYQHKRTKMIINLHKVEDDGRMAWVQYAKARVTPSPF